jgi:N-acylneuraminate cytidylyltransferase/CMP-N,N'-diacetyllegionaminic acid synthase
VALLQPTSPLRTARHLEECLDGYLASGARSTLSVCAVEHHPASMLVVRDGVAEAYEPGADLDRRRDALPPVFRPNGAIHALGVATFLAEGRWVVPPCRAYVMSREDSVDVDEEADFVLAEALLRRRASTGTR